ncbi:MAG: fatty acid desaturase family protein [Alphaproteobacteria bacterium]|nr:fatty acid desaturase family protein [Alphaproteobacteria bacterium]
MNPGHAFEDPNAPWGVTPDELQRLRRRSNWRGAWVVFHAWACVALAMALFAVWPNPVTFIAAFVIVSGRQLGLAILMHDAAHRLLFAHPRLNDGAGQWLCGAAVGADLYLYRPYHLQHHRHTQQAQDPDLELSAPFPISRASLRRKITRDLLGVTGYQRRLLQIRGSMGDVSDPLWVRLRRLWRAETPFLGVNALILGLLLALGHGWLYLTLWLWPLFTGYQLVSRLRNIAEHAVVGDANDPLRNTRSTRANGFERLTVAPYWVNHHLEHHLFVNTPCWNLPLAHALLGRQGLWSQMELANGYLQVLERATSRPTDDPGRSGGRKGGGSSMI